MQREGKTHTKHLNDLKRWNVTTRNTAICSCIQYASGQTDLSLVPFLWKTEEQQQADVTLERMKFLLCYCSTLKVFFSVISNHCLPDMTNQ